MKKISKAVISVIFVIIFSFSFNIAFTTADGSDIYVVSSDDYRFSYCLNSNGSLKVKASPDISFKEKLSIPESLDGREVTAISDRGFIGQQELSEAVIPNSVTSIGNNAFSNCYALEKVDIKGTINDMGAYPFFATPFEEKLEKYGDFVILNGDVLYDYTGSSQNIVIPGGIRVISGNLFTHLEALNEFEINSVVMPDSVEYICGGAFYGCNKIKTISFGSGIASIGENAFTSSDIKFIGYYDTAAQEYASSKGVEFEPLIEYGKQSEAIYAEFSKDFRQFYFDDEKEFSREGVTVFRRNYNGEKIEITDWEYSKSLAEFIANG